MEKIIELSNISKTYDMGEFQVHALKSVDLVINKGEFVAVMGASGSGKSTLMNMLGCLDKQTSGDYLFDNVNINQFTPDDYAEFRNSRIGFVFQGFNLLSRTTALENVELPLFYSRGNKKEFRERAEAALIRVGLKDRMHHHPNKLSGGQQQRVAIARALVNTPRIILADEPTGNLDTETSIDIMSIFQELNDNGISIVLVTHEPDIAHYARRILTMRDGKIIEDKQVEVRRNAKLDLADFAEKNRLIAMGGPAK